MRYLLMKKKKSNYQKRFLNLNLKRLSKTKKQYTKNKALNEVLNNTKPLGSQEQEDYPTLGGGVLGSDNMAEVLGYGDLGMGQNKERAREMAAVDTIKKAGVSVDQVPEDVQNALTRDYSGLMKAIDKKKKVKVIIDHNGKQSVREIDRNDDKYVGIRFPLDIVQKGFFTKQKNYL